MGHLHSASEPHVTETWGVRVLTPRVIVWALRVRPGRGRDEQERGRILGTIARWVERWARRRHCLYDGVQIQNIRSGVEEPYGGNTLVFAFVAVGPMPVDWECFASVAGDAIANAFQRPNPLLGLFEQTMELPGDAEEKADPIH